MSTLLANRDERTVRGLLLPWGEKSRASNIGAVEFPRGVVSVPRDPSVVGANIRHDREQPVGRAVELEDTDAGLVATFSIADTPEGDTLLDDIEAGRLSRLSAEVKGIVRDGVKALKGTLFGAAFVDEGAFASASLYAELAPSEYPEGDPVFHPDEEGRVEVDTTEVPEEVVVHPPEGEPVIFTPKTPEDTPSSDNPEGETMTATAVVPGGVQAAPTEPAATEQTLTGLFETIVNAKRTQDPALMKQLAESGAETLFAALSDVKISGANQVGTGTVQPKWLGELWDGREFVRKIVPLLLHADLDSLEVKGYRFSTPPTVEAWAGNKANVPSPAVAVEFITAALQRFAAGYDIAREFQDIPAGRPVLEAFIRKLVASYAKVSDNYTLAQLVAAAGTAIEAETYPTGIGEAQGKIVQGALEVIANDATPTFAILATDMFKALAYTPKDQVAEFLSTSVGLEEGSMEGFKIIPHTGLAAGNVLVGAKEAAVVHELPGSPIRVNALDLAKGGVDEAVFGYISVLAQYPEGLALVGDAVTP